MVMRAGVWDRGGEGRGAAVEMRVAAEVEELEFL